MATAPSGSFRMAADPRWSLRGKGDARLVTTVRSLFGCDLEVAAGPEPSGTVIEIGHPAAPPPSPSAGKWRRSPEGYRLHASAHGVRIEATSPRGAFWGLQTLAQILEPTGDRRECPSLLIEDWPSLPFRGTHWFPSKTGAPFHHKLLARVMPRFKLNATVVECEEARWDSHPEIAAPQSIPREALGQLVEAARGQFIEPIPLISCPGHAGWIFRNGRHLELAEDPTTPYAYCVRHPDARRVVAEVLEEAIDLFRPTRVHLGHDELQLRGRFPNPDCPRCRGTSARELMAEHVRYWRDWLKTRGIRTIIWGDMLLSGAEGGVDGHAGTDEEAKRRRKALPRDVLIADWHYGRQKYQSLDAFQRDGFSTLASTWYRPENIQLFTQSAVEASTPRTPTSPRCRGVLQTTWAGHFPDERVLEGKEERQFTAWVLAAEYAWSGRTDPPSKLGYDPRVEFRRAYFEKP